MPKISRRARDPMTRVGERRSPAMTRLRQTRVGYARRERDADEIYAFVSSQSGRKRRLRAGRGRISARVPRGARIARTIATSSLRGAEAVIPVTRESAARADSNRFHSRRLYMRGRHPPRLARTAPPSSKNGSERSIALDTPNRAETITDGLAVRLGDSHEKRETPRATNLEGPNGHGRDRRILFDFNPVCGDHGGMARN